jgi:gustatory receptor
MKCAHNHSSFEGSRMESAYFWFSIITLIVRTFLLGVAAADLHVESKKPVLIFRYVPRAGWCREVSDLSS